MDLEVVKWFSALGVGGVLAAFMFAAYRKDMRELTDQWRGQTEILMVVVRENTVAFTRNTDVVQSLHTHMVEGERRRSVRPPPLDR